VGYGKGCPLPTGKGFRKGIQPLLRKFSDFLV